MQLDLVGTLKPFPDVKPGEFFLHFAGGERGLGMRVYNESSPVSATGVLCFDIQPHPSVKGPSVLGPEQFVNRDVMVIPNAVVRPSYRSAMLNDGTPIRRDDHGVLIFVADAAFVRAYAPHGAVDVNLRSGALKPFSAHPGSMWIDRWEIVIPTVSGDFQVFERQQSVRAAA